MIGRSRCPRRAEKHQRRKEQQPPAPVAVGQQTGHRSPKQAAQQGNAHGQRLHRGTSGNAEKYFIEGLCAADDYPVVAEQQSAHSRNQADKINKRTMIVFHILYGFSMQIYEREKPDGRKNGSRISVPCSLMAK